jgi:hypothetical protein
MHFKSLIARFFSCFFIYFILSDGEYRLPLSVTYLIFESLYKMKMKSGLWIRLPAALPNFWNSLQPFRDILSPPNLGKYFNLFVFAPSVGALDLDPDALPPNECRM